MRKSAITTYEMLDYFVRIAGDKLAIKQGERELTYSQWQHLALKTANALANAGVEAGDRVAVLTYNRVEQYVLLYAVMKLGAVYVPVNYRLAPGEFKYILNQSDAKAIFVEGEELCSKISGIVAETGLTTLVRMDFSAEQSGSWEFFDRFIASALSTPLAFEPTPEKPVYQMYTSGNDGVPQRALS